MKKQLAFTKMVASGNDYIIIDNRKGLLKKALNSIAQKLCSRKFSIGADGMILVEKSKIADFRMRIFNPDGSEAEMCGNGGRCVSRYAFEKKITGRKMGFETLAGIIKSEIKGKDVKLKLSEPKDCKLDMDVDIDGGIMIMHFINTGVPHVAIFVEDIETADVTSIGRKVRYHESFKPAGTNVNFVSEADLNSIKVRTYERGVEDEVLACGTGSTASAIIAGILGRVSSPVNVITKSGNILKIYFNIRENNVAENVFLEGDAEIVFEGAM